MLTRSICYSSTPLVTRYIDIYSPELSNISWDVIPNIRNIVIQGGSSSLQCPSGGPLACKSSSVI